MEAIKQQTIGDLTVALHYDMHDPINPRKDYDHLGHMVCDHRRYDLGDEHGAPDEWADTYAEGGIEALADLVKRERGATVVLPVRLFDHSGLSMSVGTGAHPQDPGGWDSGMVGVIYDDPEQREAWADATPEDIEGVLRAEVDEYDSYLRGDVYGYTVTDPDGDVVDSCWGYIGDSEYAWSEGVYAAEHLAAKREQADHWTASVTFSFDADGRDAAKRELFRILEEAGIVADYTTVNPTTVRRSA